MVRGAQNALGNGSVPVNPGRVMPITVNAARFRRIRLPTSEGSPSNVPCHNPSLITTTAFSPGAAQSELRSEEHTSELQLRLHLVCRLLLEKKKKNNYVNHYSYSGSWSIALIPLCERSAAWLTLSD